MTAPSVIRSGVGFHHCQVLALNATTGYIAASGTPAYEGVTLEGAKVLTLNDPQPRQIPHTGDDGIFALDSLPATEPISGEIHAGKVNDTLDAILSGDKSVTIGEAKLFPFGSNNRGNENQVALIAYKQTKATGAGQSDVGLRRWDMLIFPKATLIPRQAGLTADAEDKVYTLRPDFVEKHVWGTTLTTAIEGCTRVQGFRGISVGKPKLVAFQPNGSTVAFTFPTTAAPNDAAKIVTWVDGVEQTAGVTETLTGVVFAATPASTTVVVCFYETA